MSFDAWSIFDPWEIGINVPDIKSPLFLVNKGLFILNDSD